MGLLKRCGIQYMLVLNFYLKEPVNCGLTQFGWVSLEVRCFGRALGGG